MKKITISAAAVVIFPLLLGLTRGLMQASASGIATAQAIQKDLTR